MRARFSAAELICDEPAAFRLEDESPEMRTARFREARFLLAEETSRR